MLLNMRQYENSLLRIAATIPNNAVAMLQNLVGPYQPGQDMGLRNDW